MDPSSQITIILLAAGASRRMQGRDKLLETIDKTPLIRRMAQTCLNSKAQQCRVIVRPGDRDRRTALSDLDLTIVENPDWRDGMAASIRQGIRDLPEQCQGVIIALADMPDVSSDDFNALIDAFTPGTGMICRASDRSGQPGNPVLFDRAFFPALAGLSGDQGARQILEGNAAVQLVPLNGAAAQTDLDTPGDWAAYRANRRD